MDYDSEEAIETFFEEEGEEGEYYDDDTPIQTLTLDPSLQVTLETQDIEEGEGGEEESNQLASYVQLAHTTESSYKNYCTGASESGSRKNERDRILQPFQNVLKEFDKENGGRYTNDTLLPAVASICESFDLYELRNLNPLVLAIVAIYSVESNRKRAKLDIYKFLEKNSNSIGMHGDKLKQLQLDFVRYKRRYDHILDMGPN